MKQRFFNFLFLGFLILSSTSTCAWSAGAQVRLKRLPAILAELADIQPTQNFLKKNVSSNAYRTTADGTIKPYKGATRAKRVHCLACEQQAPVLKAITQANASEIKKLAEFLTTNFSGAYHLRPIVPVLENTHKGLEKIFRALDQRSKQLLKGTTNVLQKKKITAATTQLDARIKYLGIFKEKQTRLLNTNPTAPTPPLNKAVLPSTSAPTVKANTILPALPARPALTASPAAA